MKRSFGKKILVLYPHNYNSENTGANKRFSGIIKYLISLGYNIDVLTLRNFHQHWPREFKRTNLPGIRTLFFYNHSKGLKTTYFKNFLKFRFSDNRTLLSQATNHLPDYAFRGLRNLFDKIISNEKYDYILISYVLWANVVKNITIDRVTLILTMEDCLSQSIVDNYSGNVPIEKLLHEETRLVNLFDKVICLSWEEMDYFSKYSTKPEFHYVPVFMDEVESDQGEPKIYDLLFVGSENPSNQRGIKWFFNAVYPFLNKELKILCVGKISDYVPEFPNVFREKYVANLEDVYRKSILTFNPLQDGTGMKVKVIESLAYGIPVISTTIGLSGIKPEVKEQFITANEPQAFAQAIHRLIRDKTLYLEYSKVLKKVFRENFATEVAVKELDRIFDFANESKLKCSV